MSNTAQYAGLLEKSGLITVAYDRQTGMTSTVNVGKSEFTLGVEVSGVLLSTLWADFGRG
jgi:hypothetical protein